MKEETIMSLEDKVKKIIAEKLSVDINDIVPEASFVDDLGADSLDLVELIMSMEEEFDIEISDEEAEKLVTVKDVLDYIAKHS
jgi:acyl carrier protein